MKASVFWHIEKVMIGHTICENSDEKNTKGLVHRSNMWLVL